MRSLKHLALVLWLTAGAAEEPSDNIAGVGLVLGVEGQNIVVKRILPDSPAAAQKGIHVGDWIIAVAQDKEPAVQVHGGNLAQAVHLLRGPKGTTVRLTIVPSGKTDSRVQVISFVRGELKALSGWGDGVLLADGKKAPDIDMVEFEQQKSERLSDYAGKIIVLEFWATWCGPCQPKMADLQTYSGKYPDWNGKVVLIAASVDDGVDIPAKHLKAKGWGKTHNTHNVWVGTAAKKAYHIDAIPTAYVIDRQGKVAAANPVDISEIVNHQLQEGKS
jgi:thiol-disulfide isomerase/thioredoxin